ncbi:TPA: hypothetical protein DF272_04980 [Candidatus Falkowbacteria bacterium]|nr:hypothetical protein [Candidatus Falkowbacteria bacterium]
MNINLYQQYKSAEAYLESLGNIASDNFFGAKPDLDFLFHRAKTLLALAGHPDRAYKIIHIAGTSGKGSTVNHISTVLQSAGYKVGTHYSPFISVATEKIQINQKLITVPDFIALVNEMKPIIDACYHRVGAPSYFEVWMIMALLYFKHQKVDYVVLETGCGGQYDASNAVSRTVLSVITNIGYDHTHILGKTLKKITLAKAGIIRHGGRVLTAATQPEVLNLIKKVCADKKAKLEIIKSSDPNKALAMRVGELLKINDSTIQKALNKKLTVPARFEIVKHKPTIIIDGAHNHDKISYLANQLKSFISNLKTRPRIHAIVALTDKKDAKDVFTALKPLVTQVYITRFTNPFRKNSTLSDIKSAFNGKPCRTFIDPAAALAAALKTAKPNDIILITGSFFLCSDLRPYFVNELAQLEQRTNFPRKRNS